jgi:hypothetical protein
LLGKLNHRAKVLETSYGKIDVREIINTGMFSLERAQTGYGWLQDLHAMTLRQVSLVSENMAVPILTVKQVNGKSVITPKPETDEYNIRNFIYSRTRPFHPRRLFKLLHDKFIMQLEHPDYDDDDDDDGDENDQGGEEDDAMSDDPSEPTDLDMKDAEDDASPPDDMVPPPNDVILANKRASPVFRHLFRSKGEFFLATRPHRAGEWSQAGAMITMTGGRPWFCTLPEEQYLTGDEDVDKLVRWDIAKGGEWGDRRQELVFIFGGDGLEDGRAALEAALDECLLTDEEFDKWVGVMRDEGVEGHEARQEKLQHLFEDGFPDWSEDGDGLDDGEHHHEGHDHASHAHGLGHRH